jgi:hypothetical protein
MTFPHVHDVHDVHDVHPPPLTGDLVTSDCLLKISSHCRTGRMDRRSRRAGPPVLRVLHRLEVSCQAEQGAIGDVLWNQ